MAFVNNYDLIVDIKKRLASPVPMFRQDDTARLTFKIYDDGVLFDLTGYSRSDVTFQLPSGESLVGNAELVGDKIVYNFTGIELVEEGEVKVTLSIYSGSTVVSVQPFVIYVYKRFNSDQASYIGILQELIVNVTQLEIDVRQAISEVNDIKVKYDADSIKLTEGLAKVDQAVIDEQVRETNEAQRIINENERKSNEMNRQVTFASYQDYIEKLEAVGEFVLGTQYYKNNIVRDGNGNSYMAKRDNINQPLTSIDDWMVLTKRGEKGDTGASLNIRGVLTEESQLPPVGVSGDAYSVNGSLYVWSEDSNMWVNVGYIKGEKGDQGEQGIRGEKGDIGEITEFKYVIPASNEGQTQITIPLSTLSPKDALFLTLNGTTLYPDTDYTVSGSMVTLSQPVVDYQNTTFFVRILKNIPKGTEIPTADGSLLTDGSVSKQKLELSLQQDIDRVASSTQLGKVKIDNDSLKIDINTEQLYSDLSKYIQKNTKTIYVDSTLGEDIPSKGNSSGQGAFKTLNYAITTLKKINLQEVTINLSSGNYDEVVNLTNLLGSKVSIIGNNSSINALNIRECDNIYLQSLIFTNYLRLEMVNRFNIVACKRLNSVAYSGIIINSSYGRIANSEFSGALGSNSGIDASENSIVYIRNVSGTNNGVGIVCNSSVVRKTNSSITGNTSQLVDGGGQIL